MALALVGFSSPAWGRQLGTHTFHGTGDQRPGEVSGTFNITMTN
jgi:hypothetical protein